MQRVFGFFRNLFWIVAALLLLMFVAFLIFVSWVISIIGTSVGRSRGWSLQTPVRYYKHHTTGRTVTLIGVIHIGSADYYAQIQKLIDERCATLPTRVLYEMIGKIDRKELRKLPASQREIVLQMKHSMLFRNTVLELFEGDLISQKTGLRYDDSWVRTDLDIEHVARLFTEAGIDFSEEAREKRERRKRRKADLDLDETGSWVVRKLIRGMLLILPGVTFIRSYTQYFNRKQRARDYIILDLRNDVATKGILKHAVEADVVSIWGAAHVPGIHDTLVSSGFTHQKTSWYRAF